MKAYQPPSPSRGGVLADRIGNFRRSPPAPRSDRHSITESPTQFWWQNGANSPRQTSNELPKKRALFPVHVVEYTTEGVRNRAHPALNAKAAPVAALESKQTASDSISLHSKGTAIQALQRLAASNPKLYKALLGMKKDSHGCISTATLMQVQAAMEGAASAANSRSTSHAASRAHSPDLFAGRQDHADSSGSPACSPAGSDVADSEPCAEAEHSSNYPEQTGSREVRSPDSRASAVHSSLDHSPVSGQCELQHDAGAISEQIPAHMHGSTQSRELSGSQHSSIQTSLAASKEGLMPTGTAAAATAGLPAAHSGVAVAASPPASPADSAESHHVKQHISSSVRQSPEWQSSSFAHASVSSPFASIHSSSPDRNMLGRNSLDSTGPLHAYQQDNFADISISAAQSLDGLLSEAAHQTSSETLPQDSFLFHATDECSAQDLEHLPSVALVQSVETVPRKHTPARNHTAAQREVQELPQHVMILGEPEPHAQASLPDLPAQSDAESVSASGDLSSGGVVADAHTVAGSAHMPDSAINDDAVILSADADGATSASQSSSTRLGSTPAEEPLPVASQKVRVQSEKAVVSLTAAPALLPLPVAAATAAQLEAMNMPDAQSASSQHHQDAQLSEAESVSPAASDSGSVLGDNRSIQASTHASDYESSSCAATSLHAAVLKVDSAELPSKKASPEYQVLQTDGLLGGSGRAADEGSMASLFVQVQQLQTAVTALTCQPHLDGDEQSGEEDDWDHGMDGSGIRVEELSQTARQVSRQLDKALRDFLSQMRSPSPDNDPEDQLDSFEPEMKSSAPAKSPVRPPAMATVSLGRAASSRAGQRQQHARAAASKHQSSSRYSPPAAVTAAHVAVNQLSNATMPASASMTQASPAQPSVSLDQPVQNSQPPEQNSWPVPAAAQATRHAVGPFQTVESRHDAAQQTVTAAESRTPVKAQELLTDDQSTQTPRAHASPRRLSRAPPGRDPLWPLASQAGLWEGLPAHERANDSPSGVLFASADMPGLFAPFSPEVQHPGSGLTQLAKQNQRVNNEMAHAPEQQSEQLLRHWQLDTQRQMASQQQQPLLSDQTPLLGQLLQQRQGNIYDCGQLPQQQGQVPASEQLLRQLSSQGFSEGPQLPTHHLGHDPSDHIPTSLPPASSLPAPSRAAHAVAAAADAITRQAAEATAVCEKTAAAPLHGAQGHHDAAVPAQITTRNVAAAVDVMQQQQSAGSDAHPSAAYSARPPLPLHGPHLAMGEPYYHASSHAAISGSLPQAYGRPPHGYGRPPAVPSSSWFAAAQEGQEWLPGGGGPSHVMPRHPPIMTSMSQMQRLRDAGAPEVAAPGSGLLPPNALGQPAHVLTQQHRSRRAPGQLFGQADAYKQSKAAAVSQSRGYMHRQQHHAYAQPIMCQAMCSDRQYPVPQSPYIGPLPAVHHQQHMYQSGQQVNAGPKQQYVSSSPVPPPRQSIGGLRPSSMY
ncbi:TPA: hypothetical protein ACH3X1_006346 [Trebouxia sp. C0004]